MLYESPGRMLATLLPGCELDQNNFCVYFT